MNHPPVHLSLIYRIDAGNLITWVNEAWSPFARANLGEAVLPDRVIGRDLFASVSDPTVRELYRAILKRVRTGASVEFNYRCDAPDKRRTFVMKAHLLADGGVEFVSTLLHEEERPAVSLLEPGHPRSETLLRVCSWCQNVATPDGRWLPVEEIVAEFHLLEADNLPGVTHGICGRCYAEMEAKLRAS